MKTRSGGTPARPANRHHGIVEPGPAESLIIVEQGLDEDGREKDDEGQDGGRQRRLTRSTTSFRLRRISQ
jgi:hypothetical protein